jgi:hypothetical protein
MRPSFSAHVGEGKYIILLRLDSYSRRLFNISLHSFLSCNDPLIGYCSSLCIFTSSGGVIPLITTVQLLSSSNDLIYFMYPYTNLSITHLHVF